MTGDFTKHFPQGPNITFFLFLSNGLSAQFVFHAVFAI